MTQTLDLPLDSVDARIDALLSLAEQNAQDTKEEGAFLASALQTITEGLQTIQNRVAEGRDTVDDIQTAIEDQTRLLLTLKEPLGVLTGDEAVAARASLAASAEAIAAGVGRLDALAVDMLSRLEQIPPQTVDQNEIRRLDTAREAIYSALNDVIAVAQLKQRVIDRAPNNRSLAIFTMLGVSLGSLAATVGFAVWKPGVDTHAESWGRHLLADRAFAACLDQAQNPTGPTACSIRFRPDPTPTPAKR
jgi:hypothetical protein